MLHQTNDVLMEPHLSLGEIEKKHFSRSARMNVILSMSDEKVEIFQS